MPAGNPGSKFYGDEVEFGGETGGYGSYRWFTDHPVLTASSAKYHHW